MWDVFKMHKIIDIITNSSGCTLNNETVVENHLWKNILFLIFHSIDSICGKEFLLNKFQQQICRLKYNKSNIFIKF